MASPSRVVVGTNVRPVFSNNLREDSAKKVSELLQDNHEKHHIFFNSDGFHNHIVHHLLTIYALGASPEQIQTAYSENASYQRAMMRAAVKDANNLASPATWKECIGKEKHYSDFLLFFQQEMERSSYWDVINQYLFAGDERANDLLARLHGGFLHPLIHLGFGIEFEQPAIVAEALAQAAVHANWIGRLLLPAEDVAKRNGRTKMDKTIVSLLDECNKSATLKAAVHWDDGNKIRDGVIARASDETIGLLSEVVVGEDTIQDQMAEMMNAALYFTACAQRPSKAPKIDFYYMHSVNSAIFFPAMLGPKSQLSTASKQRLLEYKIRMDIGMYISRRVPDLYLDEVHGTKNRDQRDWTTMFQDICKFPDDGHASKLIRTVAATEDQCKGYDQDAERFRITGSDYLNIGHLVMSSIGTGEDNTEEPTWGRSVGFDEAWEKVPDRIVSVL